MVLLISWVDVPIGGNVRTAILDGSNTSLDEARARRQRHDSIVFLSLQADGQKRLRRSHRKPYGEKTKQRLIAQRPPMINQAREVFCQGRFPASLIYVLIVSPSTAVPPTFMPPPSRNSSAGRPVVPGTALLPR